MLRRLLLIFCLVLTALCAGVWGTSYLRPGGAMITAVPPQGLGIFVYTGAIVAYRQEGHPTPTIEFFAMGTADGKELDDAYFANRRLGFDYVSQTLIALRLPLWPPTLLFTLLTLHLWRGPLRPRRSPGFEVQPPPDPPSASLATPPPNR